MLPQATELPRRILVRAPNWIGDQILAYPFFHYLRAAYPKAHVAVACVPWVADVQFRNLVDEVIVLPKAYAPGWRSKWDALQKAGSLLRAKGPWDLGISLPNSFSAAYMLRSAGARERIGYRGDARGWLLTDKREPDEKNFPHRADAYARLLPKRARPDGSVREFWGVPPENDLDPGIPGVLTDFDPVSAWPDAEPVVPPKGPYWVLAPGSNAESRRWSPEYFAALARMIVDATGWTGVIVGGPAEAPLGARLTEDRDLKLLDWTAQGGVTSNWPIFRDARFTVSNDSGLAHLATLMGSPTQVVWGAGNPRHTEPLGPGKVRMTMNPVDCWPCERNTCSQPPGLQLICLRGIQPETVWKEIQLGLKPLANR